MTNNCLKSEKGVTLVTLTIFIIVLTAIVGIMAGVSSLFYNNIGMMKDAAENAGDFDTLNSCLISDSKSNSGVVVDETAKTIKFEDGTLSFILAPIGLKNGDTVMSGVNADINPGNCLKLENIPVGTMVHNIEINPGQGGKLVRAAGQEAQLMAKEGKFANLRLPSGEMRLIMLNCRATIGTVGNAEYENIKLGKAGKTRHLGKRPEVRGSAMNPVDHPHGGGEGKAPVGHAGPMTPWGKPALGYKTRKNSRTDKFIAKRRK